MSSNGSYLSMMNTPPKANPPSLTPQQMSVLERVLTPEQREDLLGYINSTTSSPPTRSVSLGEALRRQEVDDSRLCGYRLHESPSAKRQNNNGHSKV